MKIGDCTGLDRVQRGPETSGKKGAGKAEDFGRLLAEELTSQTAATVGQSTAAEPSVGLDSVGRSMETAPLTACEDSREDRQGILDAIGLVDEKLGGIERSLSDPGISLKALDGLIGSLSNDARQLQQALSTLPDGHSMKQAGEELNVLSYVESVKWARGDYL